MDRNLPDKQDILLLGRDVAGDEANQIAIHFGSDRRIGKMRALEQIAVDRILVQWLALADQFVNPAAVLALRFPESNVIRFVGGY